MGDIYNFPMIVSIITFLLSTHITPGPTNIVILSSVLNFGYRRSFPLMSAYIISYLLMVVFIAMGVGLFLKEHPDLMNIIKIAGVSYLCWMAWKIATSPASISCDDTNNQPFGFWQSLVYPWLNPKAWVVYTSMISIFVTSIENSFLQLSVIISFIFIILILSTYTWALGGIVLKRFIDNEVFIKRFNQFMAALLVASVIPILY